MTITFANPLRDVTKVVIADGVMKINHRSGVWFKRFDDTRCNVRFNPWIYPTIDEIHISDCFERVTMSHNGQRIWTLDTRVK